jgi:hypothetical protein
MGKAETQGISTFYHSQVEELEFVCREKARNLRRLEAQRNDWNTRGGILFLSSLCCELTRDLLPCS